MMTWIGLVAAFLTSIAAVPQVAKAYRTRRVDDISVWQPLLLLAGMVLWLVYGIALSDRPLILANSFSICCNIILVWMKFSYPRIEIPDEAQSG